MVERLPNFFATGVPRAVCRCSHLHPMHPFPLTPLNNDYHYRPSVSFRYFTISYLVHEFGCNDCNGITPQAPSAWPEHRQP